MQRPFQSDQLAHRQVAGWVGGVAKPGLSDDGVVVVTENGLDCFDRLGEP